MNDIYNDNENNKNSPPPPAPRFLSSRRIAVSAVAAAGAAACMIITAYVPLRFSLLMGAALFFYVAFCKCGLLYGAITVAVSGVLAFLLTPDLSSLLLTAVFFAPYSLAAYFLKPFSYRNPKGAVIRIICIAALAAAGLTVAAYAAQALISLDVTGVMTAIGAPLVYILFIIFAVFFDAVFFIGTPRILKLIK